VILPILPDPDLIRCRHYARNTVAVTLNNAIRRYPGALRPIEGPLHDVFSQRSIRSSRTSPEGTSRTAEEQVDAWSPVGSAEPIDRPVDRSIGGRTNGRTRLRSQAVILRVMPKGEERRCVIHTPAAAGRGYGRVAERGISRWCGRPQGRTNKLQRP